MKSKRLLLAAVVVLVAAVALVPIAAQAQNADPNAKATFVSKITRLGKKSKKGKTAKLRVKYQCNAGTTLWVSAKQHKSLKKTKALTKEGSSKISKAWLQSHRNKFICDTKSHTGTFKIDTVEPGSKGKLRKGYAYVQFCVTTGTTEADTKLILSKSGFVKVK